MSFLISNFLKVRKKTSELVSKLEPEDMIVQSNDFVSPIKWHLGHTTWFFENFILQKSKSYKKFDKSFNYIFNSYYNGVGIYNPKEKRGTINRPLLEHVIKYRKHVDQNITETPKKAVLLLGSKGGDTSTMSAPTILIPVSSRITLRAS